MPTVLPVPQWIITQCAAERPPANKPGKVAAWKAKCLAITTARGYVPMLQSSGRSDLTLMQDLGVVGQ